MKAGDILLCPHCRERTAAKLKNILSGWQLAGSVLVCPLCGGELGSPESGEAKSANAAANKLAALLGASAEAAPRLAQTEEYGRFCRNCRHFIVHPFECRCGLSGNAADPMKDCGNFEKKEEEKK